MASAILVLDVRAVFTTREVADLSISYRFQQKDGQLAVFSRDELFLGVLDAVRHST
jgi:hypothetical protein